MLGSASPIHPLVRRLERRVGLKLKRRAAFGAFRDPATLQDRLAIFLNAVWAKEMVWLPQAVAFFEAINHRTGWGFPKFIAVKISLRCLDRLKGGLQRSQLVNQLSIRRLRVCYLKHHFTHGHFDIRVSTNLRAAEKASDRFKRTGDLLCGAAGIAGKGKSFSDRLKVDLHGNLHVAANECSLAKAGGKS